MRTFYIFKINNDYYKITKNMPYNLYKALLNIKLGTKENITYLKNEYNSLVDKYNKRELNKYIYGKMSKLDGYNLFNSVHNFRAANVCSHSSMNAAPQNKKRLSPSLY